MLGVSIQEWMPHPDKLHPEFPKSRQHCSGSLYSTCPGGEEDAVKAQVKLQRFPASQQCK